MSDPGRKKQLLQRPEGGSVAGALRAVHNEQWLEQREFIGEWEMRQRCTGTQSM